MTDHREQNSSCPRHRQEIPRDFLTEWEATSMKPTEDAMKNDEAERPAYLIRKNGFWYRPNCCGYTASAIQAGRYTMAEAEKFTHPNGPYGPRDGMHYVHEDEVICDDLKAYRTQAARIAELEASLQAVLRREEDANKAAFAHMRRITALEADGIAARKATAKNYARAEAAEVTADDLRAENERLRDAAGDLTKAMRLFWEADEAADEAKREGMACDAARYEKMATGRWQRIPCLIDALEAALQRKQEDV